MRWVSAGLLGALATLVGAASGEGRPDADHRSPGCRDEVSRIESGFGASGSSGYTFGLGWKQRWLRATELAF